MDPPTLSTGGAVAVVEVIDGDTFDAVLEGGGEERIRLIGIDAPETGECLAGDAAERLAELLAPGMRSVEADVSPSDRYGRSLRYVHVEAGMVNEILVREGLAIAREYPPDTRYSDLLDSAQAAARAAGAGLWGSEACGTATPVDGLAISHIEADAPGDDGQNLNGEWIELVNQGDREIDLTGWRVRDESASHRYDFPAGFRLEAGASVRIHSGCGRDSDAELHWCNEGSAIWNNTGDTAFLLDPAGNIALSRSY